MYHARRIAPMTLSDFEWKQRVTMKGMNSMCISLRNSYVSCRKTTKKGGGEREKHQFDDGGEENKKSKTIFRAGLR